MHYRTINLVPQSTTKQEMEIVYEHAYPGKETVSYSADDAFNYNHRYNHVIIWNIKSMEDNLIQWAKRHYPVGEITLRSFNSINLWQAWPTENKRVTQGFGLNPGSYEQFNLPGHEGVDIALGANKEIYAVRDCLVTKIGYDRKSKAAGGHNYGVRIYTKSGQYRNAYAHLDWPVVSEGDTLSAGQLIAIGDSTGNSRGDHLHITEYYTGATLCQATKYPYDIIDPSRNYQKLWNTL